MDHGAKISANCDTACDLQAECIKLTGRSDVFNANMINCGKDGLVFVSPKVVKKGAYLIVRIRNFLHTETNGHEEYIRSTGLTEVCWVEEIINEKGLNYKMGLKYL